MLTLQASRPLRTFLSIFPVLSISARKTWLSLLALLSMRCSLIPEHDLIKVCSRPRQPCLSWWPYRPRIALLPFSSAEDSFDLPLNAPEVPVVLLKLEEYLPQGV